MKPKNNEEFIEASKNSVTKTSIGKEITKQDERIQPDNVTLSGSSSGEYSDSKTEKNDKTKTPDTVYKDFFVKGLSSTTLKISKEETYEIKKEITKHAKEIAELFY